MVNDLFSIVLISAGMNHVGYIDKDGIVFTWGAGFFSRLGNGYNDNAFKKFIVKIVRRHKDISRGAYHI